MPGYEDKFGDLLILQNQFAIRQGAVAKHKFNQVATSSPS